MTPIERLSRAAAADRRRYIGLMSGTSLDGIDAVLVELAGRPPELAVRLIHHGATAYPAEVRARILATIEGRTPDVCELDFVLGERFASAALDAAGAAGVELADLTAIVSSGQTIWHVDRRGQDGVPSTLQVGQASVIRERTGCAVVHDLRTADVAAGGTGAPLVPYADWVLGARPGQPRAFLNLGGIANVTIVTERLEDVRAFDTGPANLLIDAVAREVTGAPDGIDADGALSAKGTVDEALLAELLAHPFLALPPPKSTGRETFGAPMARDLLARPGIDARDLLATVARFTAASIADAIHRFVDDEPTELIASGGGARNATVMAALAELLDPIPVRRWSAEEWGFPSEAKEAIAFCILADETLAGRPSNVPSVTGANRPVTLGSIVPPS